MGKRIGVVFPRQVRLSGTGGASRLYTHDMEIEATLTVQKTAGAVEVKADCELTATIITNGA